MPARKSITGKTFGYTFIKSDDVLPKSPSGQRMCECICKCGTEFVAAYNNITSGQTTSCGCFHNEQLRQRSTKHGHAVKETRTYIAWKHMNQRCTNPKDSHFHLYGGRGISVCERWKHSFEHFLEDMGECPANLTIDRFPNPDGNYEPGNCRWATYKEQARNMSRNRIVTVRGITGPVVSVCEHFDVNYRRVLDRLHNGWPIELAMFAPANYVRKSQRMRNC